MEDSDSLCLQELPDELLIEVFHHIGINHGIQALGNASLVCKTWNKLLAEENDFWQELALRLNPVCFRRGSGLEGMMFTSSLDRKSSSWRYVCILYDGWKRGLSDQRYPEIESVHAIQDMPDVGEADERLIMIACRGNRPLTRYLLHQRYTKDVPNFSFKILASGHYCPSPHFTLIDGRGKKKCFQLDLRKGPEGWCLPLYNTFAQIIPLHSVDLPLSRWDAVKQTGSSTGNKEDKEGHSSTEYSNAGNQKQQHLFTKLQCLICGPVHVDDDGSENDDYGDGSSKNDDDDGSSKNDDDDDGDGDDGDSSSENDDYGDGSSKNDDDDDGSSKNDDDDDGDDDDDDDDGDSSSENHDDDDGDGGSKNGDDGGSNNGGDKEDNAAVYGILIHNMHSDLMTCDFWLCADKPEVAGAWERILVYTTEFAKLICSQSHLIGGGVRWEVNLSCGPAGWLELNSHLVAILTKPLQDNSGKLQSQLLIFDLKTGEVMASENYCSWVAYGLKITDGFVLLYGFDRDRHKSTLRVCSLPKLETLYRLYVPFIDKDEQMLFAGLLPCGRYIGFSSLGGEFLIFDMVKGYHKYHGTLLIPDCKGIDDGIWVWWKDLRVVGASEHRTEQMVLGGVTFWEIGEHQYDIFTQLASCSFAYRMIIDLRPLQPTP